MSTETQTFICPHWGTTLSGIKVNFTTVGPGVYMLSCNTCHKALGPYFVPSPEDFGKTS